MPSSSPRRSRGGSPRPFPSLPSSPLVLSALLLLLLSGCRTGTSFSPPSSRRASRSSTARPSTALRSSLPRDVVVIGGGLAGLSIAHRIASTSSRHVTILDREDPVAQREKTVAGSFAAAGMLAPQSERLPAGPLLELCLKSREGYGGWCREVERGAREASLGARKRSDRRRDYTGEAAKYLWDLSGSDRDCDGPETHSGLEPWEVGFSASGGFLAPAFAGDAVATWAPQPGSGSARWLDASQVRELEPRLNPSVVGGWWFPEDASVDARRLTGSLRAACAGSGVHMCFGDEWEVKSLEMGGGRCRGVHLANGRTLVPEAVVVANGSWMRQLLPVPVTPHKGQSLSLRMPRGAPPILSRVLFAQDTYIVPKSDGRIVVGATVEPGRYDGDVTPAGMMHCLSEATRLMPSLADLPVEETWAGLRPTTPDKGPILGPAGTWDNVYLAGGYWRNGVLLAPKTGQLVGDLVTNGGDVEKLSEEDRALIKAFSWERFTEPGGGETLAANARYAAQFYPVHRRSDEGVAAAVGTELGFYEGAGAARGDRARDRKALFNTSEEEQERLERAARIGVGDAKAFTFGDEWTAKKREVVGDADGGEDGGSTGEIAADDAVPDFSGVEASDDSKELVAESKEEAAATPKDLPSIYERIRANKARAAASIRTEDDAAAAAAEEERPDPGFRIYHVDSRTREVREVPPHTSPGEFFQMKAEGTLPVISTEEGAEPTSSLSSDENENENENDGDEGLLSDGYTAIRETYGEGATAEATAEATRRARLRNRAKTSEIDEAKIGAMSSTGPSDDLASVYETIRSNKARANGHVLLGEPDEDERPALDFTIHHVDAETREVREVPPYTSPGEFLDSIKREKAGPKKAVNGASMPQAAVPNVDSVGGDDDGAAAVAGGGGEVDSDLDPIDDGSDEKTYDGYQAIMNANSAADRGEELRRMKEARMKNRAKTSGVMGNSLSL
ncbi:hypothetical protein ACHAWF_014934 [Thalassiosira exigua]